MLTHEVQKAQAHKLPAAFGICLSGYKSVRNKLFTRVDLPRPLSPVKKNKTEHLRLKVNKSWLSKFISCLVTEAFSRSAKEPL